MARIKKSDRKEILEMDRSSGEYWLGRIDSERPHLARQHRMLARQINTLGKILGIDTNDWGKNVESWAINGDDVSDMQIERDFHNAKNLKPLGAAVIHLAWSVLPLELRDPDEWTESSLSLRGDRLILIGIEGSLWPVDRPDGHSSDYQLGFNFSVLE